MTKQQGLGEYGKQRFRLMVSSIKDENFEKDKKLWTTLGRLWEHSSNEQK